MLPAPDTLNDFEYGKYVLSNLAAKRAKQLGEGAPPLVRVDSNHPLTIALAEIAAGKIKPVMPIPGQEDVEAIEVSSLIDETVPAELGMLLPGLDDLDTAFSGDDESSDDDSDDDTDEKSSRQLSDLVEDGDDDSESEDDTSTLSEDDTLSLSDIAAEENTQEEENSDD